MVCQGCSVLALNTTVFAWVPKHQDAMVIFLACVKSIGIFFIFYSSISALGLYKAFVCSSLIFIQYLTALLAWVPSNESAWADYKLMSLHK